MGKTDSYGRKRTLRTGLWLSDSHVLRNFHCAWHTPLQVIPSYKSYRSYKSYFSAHGIGSAQCATPAPPVSHVQWRFRSAWHTPLQVIPSYKSYRSYKSYFSARSIGSAQCAAPAPPFTRVLYGGLRHAMRS